jgi:hypothetical protein
MTTLGSHGTLVQIGDGATPTEAFATIGELGDIEGLAIARETHDASVQTSDWMVSIPGLKKMENVKFSINFDPADPTHDHLTGLIKDVNDGTKRNFRIIFPDPATTTYQFAAYVVNVTPSAPVDGVLTADVELLPTGEPAPSFGV